MQPLDVLPGACSVHRTRLATCTSQSWRNMTTICKLLKRPDTARFEHTGSFSDSHTILVQACQVRRFDAGLLKRSGYGCFVPDRRMKGEWPADHSSPKPWGSSTQDIRIPSTQICLSSRRLCYRVSIGLNQLWPYVAQVSVQLLDEVAMNCAKERGRDYTEFAMMVAQGLRSYRH